MKYRKVFHYYNCFSHFVKFFFQSSTCMALILLSSTDQFLFHTVFQGGFVSLHFITIQAVHLEMDPHKGYYVLFTSMH